MLCFTVSDSLWPRGLQPIRLLCPWDFSGKSAALGSHFFLQWIFPTQASNLSFQHLLHCEGDSSPWGPRPCVRPQNKKSFERIHKNDRQASLLMFQLLEWQTTGAEGAKAPRQADREARAQWVGASVDGSAGSGEGLDFATSRWEAVGRVPVEKSQVSHLYLLGLLWLYWEEMVEKQPIQILWEQ